MNLRPTGSNVVAGFPSPVALQALDVRARVEYEPREQGAAFEYIAALKKVTVRR
jgi:hypothetical protein